MSDSQIKIPAKSVIATTALVYITWNFLRGVDQGLGRSLKRKPDLKHMPPPAPK